MTTISQATLAASVMLGLVSIPAVSQTATFDGNFTQDMPNITTSESTPKQVSRTTSPEGFRASIETAFSEFTTKIASGSANASLESPDSELQVKKSSGRTEWILTTPHGKLTVQKSSTKAVETAETPQGTLKLVKQNGGVTEEFSGSNRAEVEKARKEMKQLMQDKKKKLDEKKQKLREQALPNVEVVANSSTGSGYGNNSQEHVVIVNNEPSEINLEGWKIQNNNPASYTFEDVSVPADSKLRVYSSEKEDVEFSGNAVYDTGLTWENGGDTATLFNSEGAKVEERSY